MLGELQRSTVEHYIQQNDVNPHAALEILNRQQYLMSLHEYTVNLLAAYNTPVSMFRGNVLAPVMIIFDSLWHADEVIKVIKEYLVTPEVDLDYNMFYVTGFNKIDYEDPQLIPHYQQLLGYEVQSISPQIVIIIGNDSNIVVNVPSYRISPLDILGMKQYNDVLKTMPVGTPEYNQTRAYVDAIRLQLWNAFGFSKQFYTGG